MKNIINILAMTLFSLLTSGCAGLIIDSLTRSSETGKTYAELAPIPIPVESNGRIYLYRTESSTSNSLVYGYGIKKNNIYCSIDGHLYNLFWEVFMYHDLLPGEHEVLCARYELPVSVKNNEEIYINITLLNNKPIPVQIDPVIAKTEMANLPLQNTKKQVEYEISKDAWVNSMITAIPKHLCSSNQYLGSCDDVVSTKECEKIVSTATKACMNDNLANIPNTLIQPKDGSHWDYIVESCVFETDDISYIKSKIESDKCKYPRVTTETDF